MSMKIDTDIAESMIDRQVEDILRITGQNEVFQSFVRRDMSYDSEETVRDSTQIKIKDKKPDRKVSHIGINNGRNVERNKDQKEDWNVRTTVQSYQQLGKDAQWNLKNTNRRAGNKWNQRQRLIEEVYTDKDRAAAVNLGSRDIKQSLKLKRRQDRTRVLEISEEAHPGTLLALAVHRFKAGDIYVAMRFVTKALELNPYDKNALVARSKCYLLMGNAQLALNDAEQALTEDRCFIKGLYQKAEALYHLAKFEYSLMYFYKGLHIRPQIEDFKQGVNKAQQAIINAIGKTVPSFEKFFPKKTVIYSSEKSAHTCNLVSIYKSKSLNVSSGTKLLKELHTDKVYLEKLTQNPDINDNARTDNKVLTAAKEGKEFLEDRQKFWKQQQALTPIKAAKLKSVKHIRNRIK